MRTIERHALGDGKMVDEEEEEDWLSKPTPAIDAEEHEDEYAEKDRYSYVV